MDHETSREVASYGGQLAANAPTVDLSAPITWSSDWLEFESLAMPVIAAAAHFLTQMFGERCPDYCDGCEVCRRWKLLDELTANPHDKPE